MLTPVFIFEDCMVIIADM